MSELDAIKSGPFVHSRVWRIVSAARLVGPLLALVISLLTLLTVVLVISTGLVISQDLAPVLIFASLATVFSVILMGARLRKQLLKPLAELEASVAQVTQGEPNAELSYEDSGVLSDMIRDIDSLNEELTDLYEDMDSRVARHTTRLAQKTASLKILYDVAASINQAQDLDDLLMRFLRVLKEMVNGMAATVRVIQPDGRMRLVGSIGLEDAVLREHEMLPLELCACGTALSPGDILCEHENRHCSRQLGRKMFGKDEVDVVTVSLDYHDETLGLYNLFVAKPGISGREDILELLETIGSHLGMAIAKQRSDLEARRLSIMEERSALAHELHDSLAQTLASLRFQVRLLDDALKQDDNVAKAQEDVQRIRNGVDEAHTELRELLNSFRAPIGQRGLVPALQKLVDRFGQETSIHAFFQKDGREPSMTSSEEMQILRIAQESLANIRKHAEANAVRLLLTCRAEGALSLLIEDDGVGFDNAGKTGNPGEHIGLSIMEERARRLGGEIKIESEVGEGTRVELTYRPDKKVAEKHKRWIV